MVPSVIEFVKIVLDFMAFGIFHFDVVVVLVVWVYQCFMSGPIIGMHVLVMIVMMFMMMNYSGSDHFLSSEPRRRLSRCRSPLVVHSEELLSSSLLQSRGLHAKRDPQGR